MYLKIQNFVKKNSRDTHFCDLILKNVNTFVVFWITLCFVISKFGTVLSNDAQLCPHFSANVPMTDKLIYITEKTPVTLTCSFNGFIVNISNEQGTVLTSGYGNISYNIEAKYCNESGSYICRASEAKEQVIIVHIEGCNPSLRDYKDHQRIVPALQGDNINVSVCFIANISVNNRLVLSYNRNWIRQDANDDKIYFTVTQNETFPIIKILSLFIRNVSVFDYGLVDIALPTDSNKALKFKLRIVSKVLRNDSFTVFRGTLNDTDWYLQCIAYNFPRFVSIGKKSIQISSLNNITNPHFKEYLNLRTYPASFKCDDMGTYQCTVTDFQERTRTYEVDVTFEQCRDILKLCDWQQSHIITYGLIGCRINFTVCVLTTIRNLTTETIITFSDIKLNVSIVKVHMYLQVHLISDILQKEDFNNKTITLGSQQNVTLTVMEGHFSFIGDNMTEKSITIKSEEDSHFYIIVKAEEGIQPYVTINNKMITVNTTKDQYEILAHCIGEMQYNLTFKILNFTLKSVTNYTVVVYSMSGCSIQYSVKFNTTDLHNRINVCFDESKNKSVGVKLMFTAVVYICVISNTPLVDYIGIDGQVVEINVWKKTSKYLVFAFIMKKENVYEYHAQIVIRNVTDYDIKPYVITLQSISKESKNVTFHLINTTGEHPTGCEKNIPKIYFLASKGNDCTIEFCVISNASAVDTIYLNNVNTHLNDAQKNNRNISIKKSEVGNETLNKYSVIIQFRNITIYDLARYDVNVKFSYDTWNHTFYLLDEKSFDSQCKSGINKSTVGVQMLNNFSFTIPIYGLVDRVIINHNIYNVGDYHDNKRWSVRQKHFSDPFVSCLQFIMTNVTEVDLGNYTIVIPNIDMVYNFLLQKKILFESTTQTLMAFRNSISPDTTPINVSSFTNTIATSLSVTFSLLITCLCLLALAAKNKGKIKRFCPISDVPYNNISSQVAVNQDDMYANLRHLNRGLPCNNQHQESDIVSYVNIRTADRENRVYVNKGFLSSITSSIGAEQDPCSSLETYRNSDGLVYVTISQCESLTASSGPRSREQNDDVEYATLDFTKTGRMSVKDMKRLVKKNSRKSKRSIKKSAGRNRSIGKMLSLQEPGPNSTSSDNISKRISL